jgi:hypothetical protein
MPTDWAHLGSGGYINSGGSYDLGDIFIWDTKNNEVQQIYTINVSSLHDPEIVSGDVITSYDSSVTTDTKFDITADTALSDQLKAEAKTDVSKATKVTLTNYNTRKFRDASAVLNSPDLDSWRQQLFARYPAYATTRYRFIFISAVDLGNKIEISYKGAVSGTASANILKIGNFVFDVSYDSDNEVTLQAQNQAPLVIIPQVFRMTANTAHTPPDLEFYLSSKKFNFQDYHP